MNYRHAFHAGNFADVLKHAVLCRILHYLHGKPAAFRIIDTHAGSAVYDLSGPEAERSGEWRDGIGRLWSAQIGGEAASVLAPYLDTIAALNPAGIEKEPTRYPGSAMLAKAWLRPQDRLVACEIEPSAAASLSRVLAGDARCKALRLDGWTAVRAQVPPKERRGVVLIDPPFEQSDDFTRLQEAIATAHRKWATGILVAWYPIKDFGGRDALARGLQRRSVARLLRSELTLGATSEPSRLRSCGLLIANPPWTLERDLTVLLPALAERISPARPGSFRLEWLAAEK
jgi:23S rRNA (adenine2030-N6)-methyltransferase